MSHEIDQLEFKIYLYAYMLYATDIFFFCGLIFTISRNIIGYNLILT